MYGDLFGDLPATKGEDDAAGDGSSSRNEVKVKVKKEKEFDKGSEFEDAPERSAETTKPRTPVSRAMFAPKSVSRKNTAAKASASGIAGGIGKAGTSMAFIPAAARKRKSVATSTPLSTPKASASKQRPRAHISVHAGAESVAAAAVVEGRTKVKQEPHAIPPETTVIRDPTASTSNPPPSEATSSFATSYTTASKSTSSAQDLPINSVRSPLLSIHDDTTKMLIKVEDDSNACPLPRSSTDVNEIEMDDVDMDVPNAGDGHDTHRQSQDHRHSHDQHQQPFDVQDPYDPYVPNDLLQYWERKKLERERQEQEREIQETLQRQEALRRRLEEERQEVLSALPTVKEPTALLQLEKLGGMGRGRGRGRGVSNLPAWLVEQQRQESEGIGGRD